MHGLAESKCIRKGSDGMDADTIPLSYKPEWQKAQFSGPGKAECPRLNRLFFGYREIRSAAFCS